MEQKAYRQLFLKESPNPDIIEWYTVQEIQDNFNMTLAAIYALASKNAIPKKKEGKTVCYSQKHFDKLRYMNT